MNKKILILTALISSVFLFSPKTNAQVCQNLNAGDDVQMQCSDANVTLNATVIAPNYKTTRNYDVGGELLCPSITYDGSRSFLQSDDSWSDFVIDIPFTFCFFENQYDQLLISGNGLVTFDLTELGAYSSWVVDNGLQLPTQEWQTNAIFGVFHDMDSGVQPREDRISYKTLGDAPNRVFVISFEAYQYSCNNLLSKSQIKLYESSNVIDVFVEEKPVCSNWNGGRAVVGIQNKSGTIGVAPPGRNNGVWTPAAGGELWRFVPNGQDMEYFLKWYDQDGNQINANNAESVTVNPQVETTYTAELTLVDQCNDSTAVLTDQVTVTPGFTPDIQTPVNLVECEDPVGSGTFDFNIDQTTYVLNGLDPADFNISYHTSFADADANTNPIATLNPYTSAGNETIFIRVEDATDPTCYTIRSFTLTVLTQSSADFSYNPTSFCMNETNPIPDTITTSGGMFSINNGGVIDAVTGEIDLSASGLGNDSTGIFTVTYTTAGNCISSSTQDITIELRKNATFDYVSSVCIADTNPLPTNIVETGGTFTVDNGAAIDANTGELDLSTTTEGEDYTITYQLSGNCPSSSQQVVHIDASPIANAPTTILNSCDNGDGTANFDLASLENEIIGSQTGVTLTFHASQTDAESGSNPLVTSPFAVVAGNVWARVENGQGCIAIVEVPLTIENCIIIIPQGFSPNSTVTENQTFNIPSIRTKYPNFKVFVYNRYGNEVYNGDVNTDNWNGKLNNKGDLLPAGTYFYGIKLNDEQDIRYRGWVYLQY